MKQSLNQTAVPPGLPDSPELPAISNRPPAPRSDKQLFYDRVRLETGIDIRPIVEEDVRKLLKANGELSILEAMRMSMAKHGFQGRAEELRQWNDLWDERESEETDKREHARRLLEHRNQSIWQKVYSADELVSLEQQIFDTYSHDIQWVYHNLELCTLRDESGDVVGIDPKYAVGKAASPGAIAYMDWAARNQTEFLKTIAPRSLIAPQSIRAENLKKKAAEAEEDQGGPPHLHSPSGAMY